MKSDISLRRNLFNSISETPRKILGRNSEIAKILLIPFTAHSCIYFYVYPIS